MPFALAVAGSFVLRVVGQMFLRGFLLWSFFVLLCLWMVRAY